jgi:hypothetical protein
MDPRILLGLGFVLVIAAVTMFGWFNPRLEKSLCIKARYFERTVFYRAEGEGESPDGHTPFSLRQFAQSDSRAGDYVSPVLFPHDFVMMALWAAGLALLSVALGAYVPNGSGKVAVLIALPVAYFASDLLEDALLSWLLTHYQAVTSITVAVLKTLSVLKIITLGLAHLQVFWLLWLAWPALQPFS